MNLNRGSLPLGKSDALPLAILAVMLAIVVYGLVYLVFLDPSIKGTIFEWKNL